jgi:hypothetical protein
MRTLAVVSKTERALDDVEIDEVLADYEESDDGADNEVDDRLLDQIDAYVDSDDDAADAADNPDEDQIAEDQIEGEEITISEDLETTEDEEDEDYELPKIVMATEDEDDSESDSPEARRSDDDDDSDLSNDVLEELRRADIDGPVVEMAPQDDTTSARRRPRRSPEYDPAPVPIPADVPRLLGRKPRVRRVTRVVRHVDPWSVFKIAAIAFLVLYVIVMTAGVLLWNVAYATGTIDNIERFFESFGWSSFEFNGGEIYHSGWIGGLFLVIGFTGLAVLAATLFNLITDLVGGMRFTVLEEEVVESRTSPMRRFVVRRAEPEVPAVTHDASGPIIREAVVDDSGSIPR